MFINFNKRTKSYEKVSFLKNVNILLKAREDILNSFKNNLFSIMSDTTPYATPRDTSINEDSFVNDVGSHVDFKITEILNYVITAM